MSKKSVLIVGGGFAGLEAAIESRRKGFEVGLISERDFLYIYPLSIWLPFRTTTFNKLKLSLPKVAKKHGISFLKGKIEKIIGKERKVIINGQVWTADHIVLALGAGKTLPEGVQNTYTICGTPDDTLKLEKSLQELIQKGAGKIAVGFSGNPKDKSAVRGGPAFEFILNLHHDLKKRGVLDRFELTFFAPMEKPGLRMGENAVEMINSHFDRLGIRRQYGKKIKKFLATGVVLEDDELIQSDLTMFIAGGAGHSIALQSDLPLNEAGFVQIDNHCQVVGQEGVWAIGDMAAIEGPEWKAKQGHLAEVMARIASHNIHSLESGRSDLKSYTDHIEIICMMDGGSGGFYIFRDSKKNKLIPLPFVGHIFKKVWGFYFKMNKLGYLPRLM